MRAEEESVGLAHAIRCNRTGEKVETDEFEQVAMTRARSCVESDILDPRSFLVRLSHLSIASILHEKEMQSTQAGEAAPGSATQIEESQRNSFLLSSFFDKESLEQFAGLDDFVGVGKAPPCFDKLAIVGSDEKVFGHDRLSKSEAAESLKQCELFVGPAQILAEAPKRLSL